MFMSNLLGNGPTPAAISIVEPSVSRWYARRARAAGLIAAAGTGVIGGVVAWSLLGDMAGTGRTVAAVGLGVASGGLAGVVTAALVRAWPVLRALWWWSLEIVVGMSLTALVAVLGRWSPWAAAAGLLLLAGVVLGLRPVRRRVLAWGWCAVVRHRLRQCFSEMARGSGSARPAVLPLVLWAHPTPAGERVLVWLRSGLDLATLEGRVGRLAAGCWAGEVRVVRASQRLAALVRVDVTRRDPLRGLVVSPLAGRVTEEPEAVVVAVRRGLALDLPDVPAPLPVAPHQPRRKPSDT